jgi:Skp family chaperone for outer membrane proteins
MKHLSKFLPYILAGALFFVGRFTSPDKSKELEKVLEKERKEHQDQISVKEGKINDLVKAVATIRTLRHQDSLKTSVELQAKDRVILKQQKENEKINLSRSSAAELDSLRAGVLALYPIK